MTAAVEIRRESLDSSVAACLIAALDAELEATYTGEGETFFRLESAEVASGRGAFLVAYVDGVPVGCGAVRKLDFRVAEIKRMYVAPQARGRGVGRRLLAALEGEAGRLAVRKLVLETGTRQREALALYASHGFVSVPAFGEYVGSPVSVCMAKPVSPETHR